MGDEGKNRVGQGVADVEAGPGEKAAGLVAPEYRGRYPGRLADHLQTQQVRGDKEGDRGRSEPDRAGVGQEAQAGQRPTAGEKTLVSPHADQDRPQRPKEEAECDTRRARVQDGHEEHGGNALDQDLSALHGSQAAEPAAALRGPREGTVHGQHRHLRRHDEVEGQGAGGHQLQDGQLSAHERRAQQEPQAEIGDQSRAELRLCRLLVTVGLRDPNRQSPGQARGEQAGREQEHVLNRAGYAELRRHQEPRKADAEGVVQHGRRGKARDQDHAARGGGALGAH